MSNFTELTDTIQEQWPKREIAADKFFSANGLMHIGAWIFENCTGHYSMDETVDSGIAIWFERKQDLFNFNLHWSDTL